MNDLTLVTATGDRPQAFALCEKWMAGQTLRDFDWIVADDGVSETKCTMGQKVLRLPVSGTFRESFAKNMAALLTEVRTPKVLIVEDDDYYGRYYVEAMAAYLDKYDLVGECRARYYNVQARKYRVFDNVHHASLCQTDIKGQDMRRRAMKYIAGHPRPETLDGGLWKRVKVDEQRKFLLPVSTLVVGIKGMPGRGGLGDYGHRDFPGHQNDPDGSMLHRWLGDDAMEYWFRYKP